MSIGSYAISRITPAEQWAHQVSGQYGVPGFLATGVGTQALTANLLYLFPTFIPHAIGITDVAVMVTALSGTAARAGLMDWDHTDRSVKGLKADFGNTLDPSGTGVEVISGLSTVVEPGWYAWALVADGTPTIRVLKGIDPMIGQGDINVATTNYESVNYYTATGTGMVAGGITDAAIAAGSVTAVESTSDFSTWHMVLSRFNMNPSA